MRRKGRGIVLTAAGERLNVLARECFASLLDFKSGCKGLPVEIVIGAGESIIDWVLMPRLDGSAEEAAECAAEVPEPGYGGGREAVRGMG